VTPKEPDIKADTKTAVGREETVSMMEPLLLGDGSKHRPELTDLTLELAAKSTGLRRSLPESLLASLADLVRAMNCYYSNLIEGHDTMAASRGWFRMRRSWKRSIPARFGQSRAALRATWTPTRVISPHATCRAATISTAEAI
jgi:hypothetical protein